ncbi:general negative regulator of transcription subunit 4 isoform X3 [Manihot esculenta]|uniref:RING-type domain-containing protein n=1 Tax=Manihot esculenta TaxID=3983 RepID=A0A2C9V363_MANES|nr:general negative regulator of transcription subunit 4 isoform X3 [Manihot esculenta]OAY37924.1 hypothetical protein MANES_11G139600v8 [Manihot esculenta]
MSDEGEKTCPLCTEEMDLTDQQLKPCKCGYEICVWCWHHIMDMAEKDDSEGRCPACRVPYDKEKIVGMAASCGRLVAEINIERKKSQKAKIKPSEGRKQLSSVRVIQRNLVYIVGLPLNLADEDLLQRREYFGQYGKVLKVSMSRTAAGAIQQFPNNTCSVYITYSKEDEAIRCIQSVHGFVLDGRSLKACFGTTKYCHAWLRNVPCTNPDCLYLHEIGSQEDSFTKDEIISAYTRVQQITGATNNMLWRSGSTLPPPVDDYSSNSSASVAKPIVKSTSNNIVSTGKGSPPNGSSGRSIALPAAASWGMRASSQPQAASLTSSNGSTKPKLDTVNGMLGFPAAVASANHASTLHSDMGKRAIWSEDGQTTNGKGKQDPLISGKQNGEDFPANVPEKPAIIDAIVDVTSTNKSSSPPSNHDWGSALVSNGKNSAHVVPSSGSEKLGIAATDKEPVKFDNNGRSEVYDATRNGSPLTDDSVIKSPLSPRNRGLQQSYTNQCKESLGAEKMYGPRELQPDCRTDPQIQSIINTVSEAEEDIISFDNQRLKDPEVVSHTSYQPNSANISNHSRSHSSQHSEPFAAVNLTADPLFMDNRVGDHTLIHASSNAVLSNGYPEKLLSSSAGFDRNMEHSFSLPNEWEGEHKGRFQGDATAWDVGENSIISNILSLDLDGWDDPLTSPQNLAKLLGETDKQPSSLKMSGSWKVQNSSQSRFSFARQEESRNQAVDVDSSFSVFGKLTKNLSLNQEFSEERNSYLDKVGMGNGFSTCNFEESENFTTVPSVLNSNKPSAVSRAQISAPPGFSVPNRAPPPGFSSHERMDHIFDPISGNHMLDSSSMLRNSYQPPSTGYISSGGDIEFMDPAILAVGKGRLQGGLNNPGFDMRANFPQQPGAFENEARLQLLMQRSLPPHQNLRFAEIGDSFSSLTDSYGISSRLVDQSQMSNLSPFMQMSLQHSRNALLSNGHWDGLNEVQGGNNLGVAELLRNERLGLNKFYNAAYDDSKFQMPSSGDLYNRTLRW